jgi:hypothetical protein
VHADSTWTHTRKMASYIRTSSQDYYAVQCGCGLKFTAMPTDTHTGDGLHQILPLCPPRSGNRPKALVRQGNADVAGEGLNKGRVRPSMGKGRGCRLNSWAPGCTWPVLAGEGTGPSWVQQAGRTQGRGHRESPRGLETWGRSEGSRGQSHVEAGGA